MALECYHGAATGIANDKWPFGRRLRRRLLMPLRRLPDTGLFGLTPLRTHILICGFPRSGTTLLQLMLENGIPGARRFGREVGGWRAATYSWRNHSVVISKVPHDVHRLDPLQNFYARRRARLRVLLLIRDPRDVLTSRRKMGGPEGYCVSCQRWRRYYNSVLQHQNGPDVQCVQYENLVRDVQSEQARIESFIGEPIEVPFIRFHTIPRPDFDKATLNGLRPVESSLLARWTDPRHRDRIKEVLRELPELPEALIRLGYEPDTRWMSSWSAGSPDINYSSPEPIGWRR
jgi:hypothetical protein